MKDDLWDLAVKAIRLAMPGIQQTIEQTAYNILKEDRDEKKALLEQNKKLRAKVCALMKVAYEYQHENLCRSGRAWCVICGIDLQGNPQPEHAPNCAFAREN